jgi:hypothetical protein
MIRIGFNRRSVCRGAVLGARPGPRGAAVLQEERQNEMAAAEQAHAAEQREGIRPDELESESERAIPQQRGRGGTLGVAEICISNNEALLWPESDSRMLCSIA